MRVHARVWFLSLICGVLLAGLVPVAAQAAGAFGVESFTATNCHVESCAGVSVASELPESGPFWFPSEPTHKQAAEQGFTQAGGRVPYGVTDFKVNTEGKYPNAVPNGAPVSHVRVDVARGLATAPAAVPTCSLEEFGNKEALPGSGLYAAPKCAAGTEIGVEDVTLYIKALAEKAGFGDLPVEGKVYNLVQPEGLASYFGAAVKLPIFVTKGQLKEHFEAEPIPIGAFKGKTTGEKEAEKKATEEGIESAQYYAHSFVKGSVEWGEESKSAPKIKGDYHDYFEVEVSTADPLVSSRQVLYGRSGPEKDFITNATSCPGDNTTFVTLENSAKEVTTREYTTPIGLLGCNLTAEKAEIEKLEGEGLEEIEQVPFTPTFSFSSGLTQADEPNQFTTEAEVPNEGEEISQSQVKTASITLPAGMTLNPSAAHGLEACTPAQARIHSSTFGVECPSGSELGTVALEVPTLPAGSFTGTMYLGGPESGPITGPPYTLYVVANSKRYGVSVRVKAEVIPNEMTGQLTTVFKENPEQPFTNLTLHFNRGVLTGVANPLICGNPTGSSSFSPVTGSPAAVNASFGVSITGCAGPTPPFALAQSTENENEQGGAHTSYTFRLARADGNGYLKKIRTSLPLGLVGAIPDVTLCAEAQANAGTCGAASKIGSVAVQSGAGSSPYSLDGTVYMTGPYGGQPYGLSIVVPVIAGPFNLGPVVTRASIAINKFTSQVTAESELPTIVKGIPIRLRAIDLDVNRQGFLYNPTNCATQATLTTLTSTEGATQTGLSSPFTVTGCEKLGLAPKFSATTSANVSRSTGTSLVTTLTEFPGESNIKSVKVQLPKSLPSRDSTLKQACVSATFEAGPTKCPSGSIVGTAEATTPTLPGTMKGNAYFVAHGNAAFPDLDLVLEDQGVQIILVGNTDITKGITTTTFASTPDVPVSSVTVRLPAKTNSAVGGYGDLCRNPLYMPTTITGQNGKVTKLNPVITVTGCGVKIVGHKVVGHTLYLTIQTFAAGRISGSGNGVKYVSRSLTSASRAVTLKLPLSGSGNSRRKPLKVKVRVGFVPKQKGPSSSATVTVTFR